MNNNEIITYRDKKVNIKTVYTIEYIDNKKDFDRIDTHPAAWELYKTIKTESLHDAIRYFIILYSRCYSAETEIYHVFDVNLFEEIILNDETIQERYITDIENFSGITSNHAGIIERNNQAVKNDLVTISNELNTVYSFLDKWNAKKEYEKFKNELISIV